MYKTAVKFDKDDPDVMLAPCTLATYENAELVPDCINLRFFPVVLDPEDGTWLCVEYADTINGEPETDTDAGGRQPDGC